MDVFETTNALPVTVTVNNNPSPNANPGETIGAVANRAALAAGLTRYSVRHNGNPVSSASINTPLAAGDSLSIEATFTKGC